MKNLCVAENGAEIDSFSSQYHHESRALNLLDRVTSKVLFTHVKASFPQWIIFKLGAVSTLHKLGIYLHGENNQNPAKIAVHVSDDKENWTQVLQENIEHRAGDHLFTLKEPVTARYVKYVVLENYGGSGSFTSKFYAFGVPKNE
eukprot:TRINITY_DN4610_c0_g1_i1.p1 TRINITY_DN4610_c0_g1~~TRINITY_DN4610_c0_g1_i1.p1  ORF type:complete len:156 (-),score=21.43 TRINITY_DN4610_c0_g1_i1:7-441(-)